MRRTQDPSPVAEPSRRRPPRQPTPDAIPIPDAAPPTPARVPKVKLQDVLAAQQRAFRAAVDEALGRIRDDAVDAARQAAAGVAQSDSRQPAEGDVARGLLAFADERFQALSVGLSRVEQAVQRLATDRVAGEDLPERLEELAAAVGRLSADNRATAARLEREFQRMLANAEARHRAAIEELGRQTGEGVVAVARVLRQDVERLRDSVRSLHRSLEWEQMRRPREADAPGGRSAAG